ncbi:NAD(P)/FAD-dependent oxidoreductase [Chthonobacter albigriseus]|uniref:NAD(P)/FAD-dependent oxidoreductase n=1 Tax=Chthonobacter albigriseus TaxID=1683161 RepID=UPI0015EF7DFB|nr:NAD(P)/FAD-dependent oxidoreductase [Chthonobacter albigriseus]
MTEAGGDCVIVGGGPAGLVTAVYLGRFRRRAVVIDAGESRARWIPTSHNLPGFPDGIGGPEFLDRLRAQAVRYGADLRTGRVHSVERDGTDFVVRGPGFDIRAATVVFATGVVDCFPDMTRPEQAVDAGLLRFCPVCDGFEAIDKAVGVIGPAGRALPEASYLTTFSSDVTVVFTEPADVVAPEPPVKLGHGLLTFIETIGRKVRVGTDTGAEYAFDTIYPALGTAPRSELAIRLGLAVNEAGCLVTDPHQRTVVDGAYAVGDVVNELNQIAVAAGHAAIAGTDIHNRLRKAGR